MTYGAQPRDDIKAPARGDQTYVVIYRGVVQADTLRADSAYLARERACARYHCEREHLQLGVIPDGLMLSTITFHDAPLLKTSHATTRSKSDKAAERKRRRRRKRERRANEGTK